jgi:Zn finger protein HypA/HybF involved in hydrogenase expression
MKPHAAAPHRRRAWARAALATALVLLPLAALGSEAVRAARGAVESPHGRFKGACGDCHGAEGWKPARIGRSFDHAKFGFALAGAHAGTSCTSCHASLDFSAPQKRCASCHDDPHLGELGVDCERCHTARSFLDPSGMRRAHQLTRFPLTGGHATIDCESCHPPTAQGRLRYVNTRSECLSCHRRDLAGTVPDHVAGGFPDDCTLCHSPLSWRPARFDHNATAFPLTGAHRPLPCASCHGDGVYKGRDARCVACHQGDYNGTTEPAHAAAGFPTECATCHNTTRWQDAAFDHNATAFPLTGAHTPLPCANCHGDGVYRGKDTRCVACHQTDYDGTTDPPHAGAGFAVDCAACHNTTRWQGATFDHDGPYFPIYSGAHAGRWASCATCHTNPSNYAVFTCLSCHPHSDRTETDGHHAAIAGYAYDSQACFNCHPRGRH